MLLVVSSGAASSNSSSRNGNSNSSRHNKHSNACRSPRQRLSRVAAVTGLSWPPRQPRPHSRLHTMLGRLAPGVGGSRWTTGQFIQRAPVWDSPQLLLEATTVVVEEGEGEVAEEVVQELTMTRTT